MSKFYHTFSDGKLDPSFHTRIFQVDLEYGFTSWENAEYFKQWEDKMIQMLKSHNNGTPEWDGDIDNLIPKIEGLDDYEDNNGNDEIMNDDFKGDSDEDFSVHINLGGIPKVKKEKKVRVKKEPKIKKEKKERKESKKPYYSCDSCSGFKTLSKKFYDKHMFENHEQTLCSDCGVNFTDFNALYHHSLTHREPMQCNICHEQFTSKHNYGRHMRFKHGNEDTETPKQVCPHCGLFYVDVNAHIKIKHDANYQHPHQCPHCEYRCLGLTDLNKHIKRRHEKPNPVNCPWCGKFVKELDKHLERNQCNIPEEERRKAPEAKCNICNKEFRFKHALKRHMSSIHEQKKDFLCQLCDYKTYMKSNLYLHVKRMHEGRALKETCPHCQKLVVNIEYHIRTYHTHADIVPSLSGPVQGPPVVN